MDPNREQLLQFLIDNGYLKTPEIIEAFRVVDRADFVRPESREEAYENYPLSIGEGQTISQPLTVAFMLELLEPQPGERILDIGAGSGWQTALLAYVVSKREARRSPPTNFRFGDSPSWETEKFPAKHKDMVDPLQPKIGGGQAKYGTIDAVEVLPELCRFGEENVRKYDYVKKGVVKFYCLDASAELPEGPYDKIIAAAASSGDIPQVWRERLKIGGIIAAPVDGSIKVFHRLSESEWEEEEYKGFTFVPLIKGTGYSQQGTGKIINNSYRTIGYWLLLAIGFVAAGIFAFEIYSPHTDFSQKKEVVIAPGLGSRRIGELLKREGVIRSKWMFVTYAALKKQASFLKPGEYVFFANAAIPDITEDLVRGVNKERIIVIPEGWTSQEIAAYFEEENIMDRETFLELTGADSVKRLKEKFPFLADLPEDVGLEGYLFPDTYRIFKTVPPQAIIAKMLENFDKKVTAEMRGEIKAQNKTLFEIITAASMIEKEVSSEDDRALVSGILWKRFRNDIPLQVDATLNYLTGKKTVKISRRETQIDSPYNTYRYKGLPKGPIANPGLSSIRAAIYPRESPYLYYLSANDGKTIFSRTLDEHVAAKRRYLD